MFTRKYLLCETLCHSVVNPPNNFKTMNNEINTLNRQKGAILLLDNYDSFTYNLLHVVKEQGVTDIEVFRNDEITLDEVERFDKIILSPGPGIPEEAGLLLPIIRKYAATKSILGVCLGHQPSAKHSEPHSKSDGSISRGSDSGQHIERRYPLQGIGT